MSEPPVAPMILASDNPTEYYLGKWNRFIWELNEWLKENSR